MTKYNKWFLLLGLLILAGMYINWAFMAVAMIVLIGIICWEITDRAFRPFLSQLAPSMSTTNMYDNSSEVYGHEWSVDCPSCGVFTVIQKGDPVICPKCGNTEIDTVRKL